jgi:hypothetical protein
MKPEEPTLRREDSVMGMTYEHPAFGCVEISKCQSTPLTMFMSNVRHQHTVRFTVSQAEMDRRHNHDTHRSTKPICSFSMTMVQFAELMGAMGTGSGVPCTLEWVRGEGGKPGISLASAPKRYADEVKAEFKRLGKQVAVIVAETQKALDEAKMSKTKQAVILGPLHRLAQDLGSNIPFMQDMFVEGIESIISEAKAVVEAYAIDNGIEPGDAPIMISSNE